MNEADKNFMREAIRIAEKGMKANSGGPFGAVVVKNGEIISRAYNQVTSNNDPTAHAEVMAIRKACEKLETYQLDDCVIYSSCEPCPMCLGAIYWARLRKVFFACTRIDAARAGFDDQLIYDELKLEIDKRKIDFEEIIRNEGVSVFEQWKDKTDKKEY